MKRVFILSSTLCILASVAAGDRASIGVAGPRQELLAGRIIEKVVCKEKADQSYALYLPSNYSPAKLWPLVAAFDPGARGIAPVEHFKEAAERYGYIVCGSNNSRNGPWGPTATAADAMLNDVSTRFPIDDKRVYLAGFSGGARVATRMAAVLAGKVAGVIGCGAGLSADVQPGSSLPFVYFGTTGNEDFNYPEMKQLDRSLESAGVAHRIVVFEGGHSWAPPELCVRAIEWMELQAMKSRRKPRDESFIERLFNQARDEASRDEAAGKTYDAYLEYAAIAADFKGLKDVVELENRAASLRDAKVVKQAIKQDRDQEIEQRRRAGELLALRSKLRDAATNATLNGIDSPATPGGSPPVPSRATPEQLEDGNGDRQSTIAALRSKLADLRKKSDGKANTPERLIARRVLNEFMVSIFEPTSQLIRSKKYELAIANLVIDVELLPDNAGPSYSLARAYALKGDKRRAIEALNKAVQKGFANTADLEGNHDLDSIRDEAGFKQIVEQLKQKR